MNKKEIFLSIFCVIGLCVWGAQAVTPKATLAPYESNSVPHGFDEIILPSIDKPFAQGVPKREALISFWHTLNK